jgi:glycerophosphoryl diester phosphodiesterase
MSPRVVAHRGFSAIAPENTRVAYERAIELGCRWMECDVRASADGVPIVIHDPTLDRTTSGRGAVGDRPAAELLRLDAGAWKGPEFVGEPLPSLEGLLAVLAGRARLIVELKEEAVVDAALRVIAGSGWSPEDLLIFAWTLPALAAVRAAAPALATALLVEPTPSVEADRDVLLDCVVAAGIGGLGLHHPPVDAAWVAAAHARGLEVLAWTVDAPERAVALAAAGVDAIITNRPDRIRAALGVE